MTLLLPLACGLTVFYRKTAMLTKKVQGRLDAAKNREAVRRELSPPGLRSQYTEGVPHPETIAPEGYTLDAAMIARPGNRDIQLDLFPACANNARLYPAFQDYFKKAKPPLLAIRGRYDPFFIPAGAEAYPRDNPNAVVQFLNTGHFALGTQCGRSRVVHEGLPRKGGLLIGVPFLLSRDSLRIPCASQASQEPFPT